MYNFIFTKSFRSWEFLAAKKRHKKSLDRRSGGQGIIGLIRLNYAYIILAVILVYSAVYAVSTAVGPSNYGDDLSYAGLALQIIHGHYSESASNIYTVRLLQIFPIAFFYKAFGVGLLTSAAWNISSFVLSILIAFFIGKELYNEKVGVISALLLSFFPLVVTYIGTMSDDLPLMLFTSLAVMAIVYARSRNSKKWHFATGLLVLTPLLVTPLGVLILPFLLVYILVELGRKKIAINRRTLYFAYGLIVALVLLTSFNYFEAKSPLITFSLNENYYSQVSTTGYATAGAVPSVPSYYIAGMFPYKIITTLYESLASRQFNPISIWHNIYTVNYNEFGFFMYFFVIAAIYLVIKKESRAYIPLLWFGIIFAWLDIGPEHITLMPFNYLLMIRLLRYMMLVAVPIVVVMAMGIVKFVESNKKQRGLRVALSAILVVFLIATAIPVNALNRNIQIVQAYDMRVIGSYISKLPDNTRIYYLSGLEEPMIYSGAQNLSRFYLYDEGESCTQVKPGSYLVFPKYDTYYNFAPNSLENCTNWKLVLYPELTQNYSYQVIGASYVFRAELYYVPYQNSSTT